MKKKKKKREDLNDPNRGDGLNDEQRRAQERYQDSDLGGETGKYLDHIRGTVDDPGE